MQHSCTRGAQYEEIRKLGKGDHLVKLNISPQARKKWPGLGNEVTARLLTDVYKRQTKGSGITNIISIILQQAQDYDVAKIT